MTRREVVLILVPRPSLSLHPSQGVALRDNVTLRCHLLRLPLQVELCQNGHLRSKKDMDMLQDTVEFSLVRVDKEDAGKYRCQYRVLEPPGTSGKSDPVQLVVTGWCLVAASRAQQLHRPSLSLHPSQGVSMGDTVTLRCHLPRMAAWVQLWLNGTLRFNKEKDKEQDAAEFSFAVTNLEDAGTYQCRYQLSEPLWTSNQSDPVELVLTEPTGAKRWSYGNLVVVKVCSALLALSSGLYFYFNGCSLWKRRNESAGVTPEMPESVQLQGPSRDSEDLTYTEMPAAIPCPQPPTSPTAPQSPVIYTTVSTGLPR